MNDHEMDDQIRRLSASYNEPPVTPREEMWARIEQARGTSAITAAATGRRLYWLRMGAGIAAVLVVGIGIGRMSRGAGGPAPSTVVASQSAPLGKDTLVGQPVAVVADAGAPSRENDESTTADASAAPRTGADNPVRATREERLRALSAARGAPARGLAAFAAPRGTLGVVGEGTQMSAYRLAVVEHMARSEVLLTSFLAESRANPTDGRTAAQFASLSRDLLKTTRLLLATRSTDDPALTRLLEDLELVLMQISQYTSEGRRGDLDAINQSLDRRNVLPKLRSAIPAGASATTGL